MAISVFLSFRFYHITIFLHLYFRLWNVAKFAGCVFYIILHVVFMMRTCCANIVFIIIACIAAHVASMLHSCCFHDVSMLLTCCCAFMLLPCCCHVVRSLCFHVACIIYAVQKCAAQLYAFHSKDTRVTQSCSQ